MTQKTEKLEKFAALSHENVTNDDVLDFALEMIPYGIQDILVALRIFKETKRSPMDLANAVDAFADDMEFNVRDVDVCHVAVLTVLDSAKDAIREGLGIDIDDDTDFHVISDYMCSEIDYGDGDIDRLKEILENADASKLEEISGNADVAYFLESVGII